MASGDDDAGSLSLRVLPASLRTAVCMPGLRRTLDDRADVVDGDDRVQPLWCLDADPDVIAGY